MYVYKAPNAAGSKITVTNTATDIFSLINTAASTSADRAGYPAAVNSIVIQPEDGAIRVLFDGNTPTATNGFLIPEDSIGTFIGVPLNNLKLIRTSGDVVCSVMLGRSDKGEGPHFALSGGSGGGDASAANQATQIAAESNIETALSGVDGALLPTAIDSYGSVAMDEVTGANQSLISAPGADHQIWVYGIQFVADTDATTVEFQDEDDTVLMSFAEGFAQYGGISIAPSGNFAMPLFKVASNKALEADVATGGISGAIQYAVVDVS